MNESGSESSRGENSAFFSPSSVAFLAAVSLFIYLQLFIFPNTPVFVEGDQLLPVSNAMRLLDGEVMYRDFFHFAPPGTELYYASLFYVFGEKIWVMNATVFVLAITQLLLVFAFSRRLLGGYFVYLPTLIYFVIGFRPFGIDGSYRLFSVVFVLWAAFLVMKRLSLANLAIAGGLCGIASIFVQTRGLLGVGAIGLFLLWHHWTEDLRWRTLFRDWAIVGGSFLAVVLLTQIPAAYFGGFENYYFANVTFLKNHYGSDSLSNTLAYFSDLPDLRAYVQSYGTGAGLFRFVRVAAPTMFFYAIVPLTFVGYFLYRWFRPVERKFDKDLILLSILGSVFFIGVSAPTAVRLYHISIPAVVVLVWLIGRATLDRVAMAMVGGLAILGLLYTVQRQTAANLQLELPAGKAAFLSATVGEKYAWLAENIKPGESIYEAQHPTFYFPLHLKNPTPFYLVRDNNYTPDFQVQQLVSALESRPPRFIIWHGLWSKEASERAPGDNLDPLWQFIQRNYALKREFHEIGEFTANSERDIEFWERKY